MELRRYRALHQAGVSISAIARETGRDWRTVRKYLAEDAAAGPPAAPPRAGTQPRKIDAYAGVVDASLRADIELKASVIHERLVAEYGFAGHYQRVKLYVGQARPRIAAELGVDLDPSGGLHRRFAVTAGAQAQVDWGDEGGILAHVGIPKVYSFHLTLSYSRDTFCCYVASADIATFFECHRRAFAFFGGVPASIVYDRTKTIVKRHVAPGKAVPIHPEAAAFADHYGFAIDVLAARRPTGKGRVERQVNIVREHVLAGRVFCSLAELDAAFTGWVPIRRRQIHRTHHEVIGVRATRDHAALAPLPAQPYLVADTHTRRVGRDALVSFDASMYSVPASQVRAGQRVELRVSGDTVAVHALAGDGGELLAVHSRARQRGQWVIDEQHWAGLPDGHTRAVTLDSGPDTAEHAGHTAAPDPLAGLLARNHAAATEVATRPLSVYQAAALGAVPRQHAERSHR
ncbi:MAG: IS21 family transposase [Streptosporangiales bacterium]